MLALESIFFSALSSQDLTYHYYSCFSVTWSKTLRKNAGTRNESLHVQPSCWGCVQPPAPQCCHLSQVAGTKGQSGQRKETGHVFFFGISLCVQHVWLGKSKVRGSLTWNNQQRAPLRAPTQAAGNCRSNCSHPLCTHLILWAQYTEAALQGLKIHPFLMVC